MKPKFIKVTPLGMKSIILNVDIITGVRTIILKENKKDGDPIEPMTVLDLKEYSYFSDYLVVEESFSFFQEALL